MKKLTVIILLFAVLFGISTAYISAEVNSGKDKVSFEENVLLGDKIYANGVTFTMETNYARKLNWKTDYTIGFTPECNTEYRFSAEGIPDYDRTNSGIDILSDVSHLDFIQDKYREAVNTAKKENKSVTYKIKLKDHIEYFPFTVDVDLPNIVLSEENRKRLNEKVNEFFKIPVPDDFEVTISADSGGETSSVWCDYYKQLHGMIYSQDTVFLSSFNDDDNRIYSINYGENEVYENTLKIAYEPEEIFEINEVDITDKTLVLLGIDKRHRQTLLRVLDLKTMECIQNMQVSEKISDSISRTVFIKDDFLGIEMYDYHSKANENDDEAMIHFYNLLPDGTYKYSITVYKKYKNYLKSDYLSAVDFDGQRAAFAEIIHPNIAGGDAYFDINVSVYDKDGLVYMGEYKCSLSKHDKQDYLFSNYSSYLDINIG